MTTAIGIDLGGTNIKGVLLNATTGEILYQAVQATESDAVGSNGHGSHWKQAVFQMVQDLKSKSAYAIEAIGVAAPGLPNSSNSAICNMPGRLDGLENLVWSEFLGEKEVSVL